MIHFSDAELSRWSEGGPGDDRTRVLEHLRECAACAGRYAAAVRARAARVEPASDAADFVDAGYAAAAPPKVLPFVARRRWVVVPAAAAAALVAAIALQQVTRRGDTSVTPRFRGAAIHALAPAGDVEPPITFTWSSGLAAARFRLEVGGPDGVLYSTETDASRADLPVDAAARLSPGVQYWWTVTAFDRSGAPITTSPRRTFAIRPR